MKYALILLIIVCTTIAVNGQNLRSLGLGGVTYSLNEEEIRLTPFGIAKNPATIYSDETHDYLKIIPNFSSETGDYRRQYDPEGIYLGGLNFRGLKTLGDKGTFLGEMGYTYEHRDQVSRSLSKDPYTGEAFFMVDTTKGNITYSGPRMTGMYSWELFEGLDAGFSVSYGILSGLKSVYTYAKTIYRDASIVAGLSYNVSDNTIIDVKFAFDDNQETIEASDVNLLDVELFNFVGETYSLRNRSSAITQKIRKVQYETSFQIYSKPFESLEIGANAGFSPASSSFIIPYLSYDEYTLGYSQRGDLFADIFARYFYSQNLTAGAKIGYCNYESWSKNSKNGLLLWEWNYNKFTLGAGTSYRFDEMPLLAALEAGIAIQNVDSSKYIDRRSISESGSDFSIRGGLEYEVSSSLAVRAGYHYSGKAIDMVFGLKDVTLNQISFGCDYYFKGGSSVQLFGRYTNMAPSSPAASRSVVEAVCQLKLKSF